MTPKQYQTQIGQLSQQVDTQAATIKRLWVERSRLKKTIDFLTNEVERERGRPPTEEEIREAIFGGQE